MIITPTETDISALKKTLLKLIEENKCDISDASDSAMRAGLGTIGEPIPVSKLIIERAIIAIREEKRSEEIQHQNYVYSYQKEADQFQEPSKIDAIGPALLKSEQDDLPF